MSRLAVAVALGVLTLSLVSLAPPATATHAYQCGVISDSELVTRVECGVHCTWDAITGANFKNILLCLGLLS